MSLTSGYRCPEGNSKVSQYKDTSCHIANEDDLGERSNLMPAIRLASAIEDAELIRMARP